MNMNFKVGLNAFVACLIAVIAFWLSGATAQAAALPVVDSCVVDCYQVELVSAVDNGNGTTTLTWRITNHCNKGLSHVSFGLPAGVVATEPAHESIYTAPSGRQYQVENPTNNPFYAIKFNTTGSEGIKDGESDLFSYTIPGSFDPNAAMQVEMKAGTNQRTLDFSPSACQPNPTPTPEETPEETPTTTPTETPEPPVETPTETPEPPVETPTETPEPPVETPTETPEPPVETPTETPEPPVETPTATPEPPVETPTATPQSTDIPQVITTPTETPAPPTSTPEPPSDPPFTTPELAAIGDYVWEDVNGNGRQDEGEPPVAGVIVRLFTHDHTLVGATQTDGAGRYGFAGLQPGSYYLVFDPTTLPPGYKFTQPNQGDLALDSDADPLTGATAVTVLHAGQTDLTWDAGLIKVVGGSNPTNLEEGAEPTGLTPRLWLPLVGNHS
jgi:hypothetical protein